MISQVHRLNTFNGLPAYVALLPGLSQAQCAVLASCVTARPKGDPDSDFLLADGAFARCCIGAKLQLRICIRTGRFLARAGVLQAATTLCVNTLNLRLITRIALAIDWLLQFLIMGAAYREIATASTRRPNQGSDCCTRYR